MRGHTASSRAAVCSLQPSPHCQGLHWGLPRNALGREKNREWEAFRLIAVHRATVHRVGRDVVLTDGSGSTKSFPRAEGQCWLHLCVPNGPRIHLFYFSCRLMILLSDSR